MLKRRAEPILPTRAQKKARKTFGQKAKTFVESLGGLDRLWASFLTRSQATPALLSTEKTSDWETIDVPQDHLSQQGEAGPSTLRHREEAQTLARQDWVGSENTEEGLAERNSLDTNANSIASTQRGPSPSIVSARRHKDPAQLPPSRIPRRGKMTVHAKSPEIIDLVSSDESTPIKAVAFTDTGASPASNSAKPKTHRKQFGQCAGGATLKLTEGIEKIQPKTPLSLARNARAWRDINEMQAEKAAPGGQPSTNYRTASSSSKGSTSKSDAASNSSLGSIDSRSSKLERLSNPSSAPTTPPDTCTTLSSSEDVLLTPRTYRQNQAKLNSQGDKTRAVSKLPTPRRPMHKQREHIKAPEHRNSLPGRRAQIREHVEAQMYEREKLRGFKGSRKDFNEFVAYLKTVQALMQPGDLRRGEDDDLEIAANYFENRRLEQRRQIEKIHKAPLPAVFTPEADAINKKLRVLDLNITERTQPQYPKSLSEDEERQVNGFLRTAGVVSSIERERVTAKDLSRLHPGQWLNDEIINFYGALLMTRAKTPGAKVPSGKVHNVHYFSTFFWEKLEKDGYEKGRLAKWTKKIDIFSKDYLLIPVNHHNSHWTAAAVNFKKKRIESYDSLGMAGKSVCKKIREYLAAEHQTKKGKPFNFDGWEDYIPTDNPQQQNNSDCGVFTCQTLEAFSRGEEKLHFTQANMPYLRRRMLWEIGNAKLRETL